MLVKYLSLILILLSACQVFLGPDPDTSDTGVLYSLWKDFNEIHAYIQIRMDRNPRYESWDDVFEHYNTRLEKNEIDLFSASTRMLGELEDPHVSLYATSGYLYSLGNSFYTYRNNYSFASEKNEFIEMTRNLLTDRGTMTEDNMLLYGSFISDPHIGYLFISQFVDRFNPTDSFNWVETVDESIDFFRENTSVVIIDIRYNTGGLIPALEYIAARFAAVKSDYIMASTKNGPGPDDFSSPLTFRITPAVISYTKPVVVLTNKVSMSASEWFTLAMRNQPHAIHLGLSTAGAFSIRTTRPMINGWYYSISAHKVTDMEGLCYEGFGVRPQVEITGAPEPQWAVHPGNQLKAVLEWINENKL